MELFTKLDKDSMKNGLIKELGGVKHFSVLAVIASYANEKGESFPSQETISQLVGYSRKTVNEVIKDLNNTKINNEYVLEVKTKKSKNIHRNLYILNPFSGFQFGNNVTHSSHGSVTHSSHGVVKSGLQEVEPEKKNQLRRKKKILKEKDESQSGHELTEEEVNRIKNIF